VLTALSNNHVQVRQVLLGSGDIRPFKWLSSERWYQGHPDWHQSFLLLKGAERAFNLDPLEPALGKPIRIENDGDYRAIVYPFDIAQRLGRKLSTAGCRLRIDAPTSKTSAAPSGPNPTIGGWPNYG
jgi:hypothetical protein